MGNANAGDRHVQGNTPDGGARASGALSRRDFVQTTAGFLSLAAAGGLLGACGSGSGSGSGDSSGGGDVTFGFSHPYSEVPVVANIQDLVKKLAEREGWEVLLDQTQGGNLQSQLSTLDTWITRDITAICAFPTNPTAFEASARRADDAGIVWTTYGDRGKTSAGGVLFPPDLSGEVVGKGAVEWINANDPDAEVLILEEPTPGPFRQRTDIPMQMIKEQTEAKVVAVQPARDQTKGLQVTEDLLQAHPNATVVVAINDDAGLGAAQAFRKAGKQEPSKVWIVGQDGSKDALSAIRDGDSYFRASAALDLGKLCQAVVDVTKRAIEHGWKEGDKQDYQELAPTLIQVGDTELVDRFLSYQ